ncbi:MAG: LUD domain-containing protein, partial [Desulfobacteraceae bacterium]
MMSSAQDLKAYRKEVTEALSDDFLRDAMENFAVAYRASRKNAFKDKAEKKWIDAIATLKDHAIENMDYLYNEFKAHAQSAGVNVHLAENAEDANQIITAIARKNKVQSIIKSKSMTAEEIRLNHHMEAEGFEVTETDLGEWIIQLRKEGPSHMVMPAIHLSRFQVAKLFSSVTGYSQPDNIQKLVKVARRQLRQKFATADMGISGANFAIADTGTIGLVTNEGNARLVTTLPRVHVALVGLEKLIPTIDEALKILQILPRNATGQALTSYVTWISGAAPCATSPTQRKVMHIVFLDNGR